MTIAPRHARAASHTYRTMREFVQAMDDTLPGKFEITEEGIVQDMTSPHEVARADRAAHPDKVLPADLVAHTGTPDVEDEPEGIMRHPDVVVIVESDLESEGTFDARTLLAAVEVVSRSNPENDWVGKIRDYPAMGIPVYVIFDPRTGTGGPLTDIHPTPEGPRYATRKGFVYGEDVTIADWTIPTERLPRYT